MFFIGIDPGKSGAISIMKESEIIEIFDMPTRYLKDDEFYKDGRKKKRKDTRKIIDSRHLYEKLRPYANEETIACIESVSARENEGSVSTFTFGGMLQGLKSVLECLDIKYVMVSPRKWQSFYGFKSGEAKEQSFNMASSIFDSKLFTGPRGGIKDGRTDAVLICNFLKENYDTKDVFWVAQYRFKAA